MPGLDKRIDRACGNLGARWYSCSATDDYERSAAFQGCCSEDPCHLLACPDQKSLVTKSTITSIVTPTIRMETSSTTSSTTALVNMLSATASAALSLTSSGSDSSSHPSPSTALAIEESGIKFPTTKSDVVIAIAAATTSGLLIVAICLCLLMRHRWGLHDCWRCDVSRGSMKEKNGVPGMTLLNHHDSSLEELGGRCKDFSNLNGYRISSSRGVNHASHSFSNSALIDNDDAPLSDFEKNQLLEPPIDAHPAYRSTSGLSTVPLHPSRLISCEFSSPHRLDTIHSPRITPIPVYPFSDSRHLVSTNSYDNLLQKCHSLPSSYDVPLNSHKYGTLVPNLG